MPKRVGWEVERRLLSLANEHPDWTAGQLADAIGREHGPDAASERWIRGRLPSWRDRSTWTLATDDTGRPDIVLRVLAAALDVSKGKITQIGKADAAWVVRLATALPRLLDEARPVARSLHNHWRRPLWELLVRAQMYRSAEERQDTARLIELDAEMASEFAREA
jgi:hypothetical protein